MELKGNTDKAVTHYLQALQIKPDYAEAYNNLGLILQAQNRLDEAVSHFERALQLKPDDADIHNNLGTVFLTRGQTDEAINCFRRSLKLKPDFALANSNLGFALMSKGDFDRAAERFKRALKTRPDYFSPLTGLAWILATHPNKEIRDGSLAVTFAKRAAELTGNRNAYVLNTLAAAYTAAGRLDQAREYYHLALQIDPNIKPSEDLEAALRQPEAKEGHK
jgi:Flp pilus assembly protein TadD